MPQFDSYPAGRPGYNRVRVYRRTPDGPFQVEWRSRTHRRVRETLTNTAGHAIYDLDLAQKIADAMAGRIAELKRAESVRQVFGKPVDHTLSQLLAEYHASGRASEWSAAYRKEQNRHRAFWLDALGTNRVLRSVSATEAERAVRTKDWSARTRRAYLQYLQAAYGFGQRKLKWLDEKQNLSNLDVPKAMGEGRAYAEEELWRLLEALPTVDLRAGALGEVCFCTGRRLSAVRTLPASAYQSERVGGAVYRVLQFPATTDKARRRGRAPLSPEAVTLLDQLVEAPAVRATGLLFPAGKLEGGTQRGPIGRRQAHDWLTEAEARANIEHVEGRAWHALKRSFSTLVDELEGASEQSGTDRATLARYYRQERMDLKVRVVEGLERRRRGAS